LRRIGWLSASGRTRRTRHRPPRGGGCAIVGCVTKAGVRCEVGARLRCPKRTASWSHPTPIPVRAPLPGPHPGRTRFGFKARTTSPRTAMVYCHPTCGWPTDPQIAERCQRVPAYDAARPSPWSWVVRPPDVSMPPGRAQAGGSTGPGGRQRAVAVPVRTAVRPWHVQTQRLNAPAPGAGHPSPADPPGSRRPHLCRVDRPAPSPQGPPGPSCG